MNKLLLLFMLIVLCSCSKTENAPYVGLWKLSNIEENIDGEDYEYSDWWNSNVTYDGFIRRKSSYRGGISSTGARNDTTVVFTSSHEYELYIEITSGKQVIITGEWTDLATGEHAVITKTRTMEQGDFKDWNGTPFYDLKFNFRKTNTFIDPQWELMAVSSEIDNELTLESFSRNVQPARGYMNHKYVFERVY